MVISRRAVSPPVSHVVAISGIPSFQIAFPCIIWWPNLFLFYVLFCSRETCMVTLSPYHHTLNEHTTMSKQGVKTINTKFIQTYALSELSFVHRVFIWYCLLIFYTSKWSLEHVTSRRVRGGKFRIKENKPNPNS